MFRRKMAHCGLLVGVASAVMFWVSTGMAASRKALPCAADLRSCPDRGCAQVGSPEALANQVKRTWPVSGTPIALTIGDFESLQGQADALVGQGVPLSEQGRRTLRKLKHSGRELGEGDLVQFAGYIVDQPYSVRSGESVNCRIPGTENRDIRIAIAPEPDATEFDGIAVVMIPQWRPRGWSLDKLVRIAREGHMVLVRGQLFYDSEHRVNDDPEEEVPGQIRRISLWEIHPVTDFYVCLRKGRTCEAQNLKAWERLELAFQQVSEEILGLPQETIQEEEIK